MLGSRIRELRLSLGMSQIEFGNALNVTKQSVSNWENGNIMPSVDMLERIAEKYSVSADYLLDLAPKTTIDVTGLTNEQISHLQLLINDLKRSNRQI